MSAETQQVQRGEKGRWLEPPPASIEHRFTTDNARTMAKKRWDKFRHKANSRIVREAAAIDPTVSTPADAYGLLASKQFVALMDYDKPRIDELEKMAKLMTGYEPTRDADTDSAVGAVVSAVNAGTAHILAQVMADVMKVQKRQAVEGTVTEVEE